MKSLITIFLVFFGIFSLQAGTVSSDKTDEESKRQVTFSGSDYSVLGSGLLSSESSGLNATLSGNEGVPVLRSNPWGDEYDPDTHGSAQGNTGAPISDGWIPLGVLLVFYMVWKKRHTDFTVTLNKLIR